MSTTSGGFGAWIEDERIVVTRAIS